MRSCFSHGHLTLSVVCLLLHVSDAAAAQQVVSVELVHEFVSPEYEGFSGILNGLCVQPVKGNVLVLDHSFSSARMFSFDVGAGSWSSNEYFNGKYFSEWDRPSHCLFRGDELFVSYARTPNFAVFQDVEDPNQGPKRSVSVSDDVTRGFAWEAFPVLLTTARQANKVEFLDVESMQWNYSRTVQVDFPWGIAVDQQRRVWVTQGNEVMVLHASAGNSYTPLMTVELPGTDSFNGSQGIAIDSNGIVYVADTLNHRIVILDSSGTYVGQFGRTGDPGIASDYTAMSQPTGLAIHNNLLYVTEKNQQRFRRLSISISFSTGMTTSVLTGMTTSVSTGTTSVSTGTTSVSTGTTTSVASHTTASVIIGTTTSFAISTTASATTGTTTSVLTGTATSVAAGTTTSDVASATDSTTNPLTSSIAMFIGIAVALFCLISVSIFVLRRNRVKVHYPSDEHELPCHSVDTDYAPMSRHLSRASETPIEYALEDLDCRYHIRFDELKLGQELASGNFGVVYRAEYTSNNCVVKLLKDESQEAVADVLREALQLSRIRPHASICAFYGACLDPGKPLCLVTEYIEGGNLGAFLQNANERIRGHDVVNLSRDLAAGMTVLHRSDVLHLDLATRNLLVLTHESPLKLRICDFGLSQTIPEGRKSVSAESCQIPWRWTPPEVVRKRAFDKATDLWAFGVCVYQMLARCARPYTDLGTKAVIPFVAAGNRLARPDVRTVPQVLASDFVVDKLYELMLSCWDADPLLRPSFSDISDLLSQLLENPESDLDDLSFRTEPSLSHATDGISDGIGDQYAFLYASGKVDHDQYSALPAHSKVSAGVMLP